MKKQVYVFRKYSGIEIGAKNEEEIARIKKALQFVRTRGKKFFIPIQFLKSILVRPKGKYNNLLFPREGVYVCEPGTINESSKSYLGSLFVHEGTHMKQYIWKRKYKGNGAEQEAYMTQRKFLKIHGSKDEVEWLDSMFKDKWWVKKKMEKGKKNIMRDTDKKLIQFCAKYINGKLK
ncbi:MAG: hypothetical protein AB1333_00440 [Patescibacteria group bacterium]